MKKNTLIRIGALSFLLIGFPLVGNHLQTKEAVLLRADSEGVLSFTSEGGATCVQLNFHTIEDGGLLCNPLFQYSFDQSVWIDYEFDLDNYDNNLFEYFGENFLLNESETIYFRANLENYGPIDTLGFYNSNTSSYSYFHFAFTNPDTNYEPYIDASGSVTSLLDGEGMDPEIVLSEDCFYSLFKDCTLLRTAPSLISVQLGNNCYSHMFEGCTALTIAPEFPSGITELKPGCFFSMFKGCTNLTEENLILPELQRAPYCFANMFEGCETLTIMPALNSIELAEGCYEEMFKDCISLEQAYELPACELKENCYRGMFEGCTLLSIIPSLENATVCETNCCERMFYGCESFLLTNIVEDTYTIPFVLNSSLTDEFRNEMFQGCSIEPEPGVQYYQKGITVTYYANTTGTTGVVPVDTYIYNAGPCYNQMVVVFPQSVSTLKKEGWKITKWNSQANGQGTNYSIGSSIALNSTSGSISLYAVWEEKVTVSITTPVQSGTYSGSKISYTSIDGTNKSIGSFVIYYKLHSAPESKYSKISPTNAGSYDVKITRVEDNTYKSYSVVVANGLIINPAKVNEPVVTGSYTYTNSSQTPTITGVESYMTPSGDTSATDAGNHIITYSLDENHAWDTGSDGTVTWTIAKAQAAIIVDQTPIVTTYGDSIALPTATSNFGTPSCDKTAANLVDADNYTVTYSVDSTSNYDGDSKQVSVTINKKQVVIPSISTTYTYTGNSQSVSIDGFDSNIMKHSSDSISSATNVGDYQAKIELKDSANYEWASTFDGILDWSIAKASNSISLSNSNSIEASYGDTIKLPTSTSLFGEVTCDHTLDDLKNVGNYTVTYSVASTSNYDGDSKQINVTINKLKVDEPTALPLTYNGLEQNAVLSGVESYMTCSDTSTIKATNVGTYEIVYSLDNNHAWKDGQDGKVSWTITKAQASIEVDASDIVKDYGESFIIPTATSNFGVVTCKEKVEDFVKAGTYTITYRVAATSNYNGDSKVINVTINKAKVKVPSLSGSYVYTGNKQTVTVNDFDSNIMKYGGSSTNEGTSAGNYIVTVELKDTINYEWKDSFNGMLTWTIAKAKVSINVDTTDIIKKAGETVTLPTATSNFGDVNCNKTSRDLKDPGVYTVIYSVNSTSNYEGASKELKVTIKSSKITANVEGTDNYVIVESSLGFDDNVSLEVGSTAESDVSSSSLMIDYYNFTSNTVSSLSVREKVAIVYEIKLYATNGDEKVEYQLKDGEKLTIKLKVPTGMDGENISRILHVHSANDIEEIAFDENMVTDDGYYVIEVDRLSEFAIIHIFANDIDIENLVLVDVIGGIVVLGLAILAIASLVSKKKYKKYSK